LMRKRMAKIPNYVRKILEKLKNRRPPVGVTNVLIRHDDWCDIFKGKPCNCNPGVIMEDLPKKN
jgi:hypothetical protein